MSNLKPKISVKGQGNAQNLVAGGKQRREVELNVDFPISKIEQHLQAYSHQTINGHVAHAQAIVLEEVMLIILIQASEIAKQDGRVTIDASDIATALDFQFNDTFLGNLELHGANHTSYQYV